MRLKISDIKALQKGLEESPICPPQYQVFLFGSRVNDSKKGGDIDLLMVVDDSFLEALTGSRHHLATSLKKYIDDQKLDITLIGQKQKIIKFQQDPFFISIKDSLVFLFGRN